MNLQRLVATYPSWGVSKTNAAQGRVNLWIRFVNRKIYSRCIRMLVEKRRRLQGSQGAYLQTLWLQMSLRQVVLWAQERFGGDVGILATPRNRFSGKISLTACVWEAGRWDTEEIQGYKSTKPDPPLSIWLVDGHLTWMDIWDFPRSGPKLPVTK